jgi:hypothetical protein
VTRCRAQWEPILDSDTFDRLQAALAARRIVSDKWTGERRHLLSGSTLRCGVCGSKVHAHKQSSGQWTYRCRGHVTRDETGTNEHVLREVAAFALLHPIHVGSWESQQRADLSDQIERLERQAADLDARFVTSGGDVGRLGRMLFALDAQLAALREEQMERLALETGIEWAQFDLEDLLATTAIDSAGIDTQRAAIALYAQEVVIHPAKKRGRGFDPTSIEIRFRDVERLTWRGIVEQ